MELVQNLNQKDSTGPKSYAQNLATQTDKSYTVSTETVHPTPDILNPIYKPLISNSRAPGCCSDFAQRWIRARDPTAAFAVQSCPRRLSTLRVGYFVLLSLLDDVITTMFSVNQYVKKSYQTRNETLVHAKKMFESLVRR